MATRRSSRQLDLLREFQEIGRDLFVAGLISSHGGNMSVRRGDSIIITRHSSMLGRLKEGDLVETRLGKPDGTDVSASTELVVHRAIYLATPALAVVHAHPTSAVALSLTSDEIVPLDLESTVLVGRVPVVEVATASGSQELADAMCETLCEHRIAVVRGHGSFAVGKTVEEAYEWTSCLEQASRVILSSMLIKGLAGHRSTKSG